MLMRCAVTHTTGATPFRAPRYGPRVRVGLGLGLDLHFAVLVSVRVRVRVRFFF